MSYGPTVIVPCNLGILGTNVQQASPDICLPICLIIYVFLHVLIVVTATKAKAYHDAIAILGQAASKSEGCVQDIGKC